MEDGSWTHGRAFANLHASVKVDLFRHVCIVCSTNIAMRSVDMHSAVVLPVKDYVFMFILISPDCKIECEKALMMQVHGRIRFFSCDIEVTHFGHVQSTALRPLEAHNPELARREPAGAHFQEAICQGRHLVAAKYQSSL
eukprot:2486181-Pleurochrysis_carterae.AAC.15